ncbi:MAG: sugar transferase [Flavobacterium sp.]
MIKRLFDILISVICLATFGGVLLICILIASVDINSFGLFFQSRIGQYGKPFTIFKIKTFSDRSKKSTKFGRFLRATKLDELPQLFNVLIGNMSLIGPRPDIAGYADTLSGKDRIVLNIKPGITGLASLKYRNEEDILASQENSLEYNDTVIWPDKVRINRWYVQNHTFTMDLLILYYTIFSGGFDVEEFMKKSTV